MKTTHPLLLLMLPVALLFIQACENKAKREEVKEEYREAGRATGEYFEQERDSAVKSMREQKARVDARLEKTRAEARAKKGEARQEAEEQIDKLDRLSKRLEERIEEARATSRERWEQTKTDIKQAANDIEAEWNSLVD